MIDEREKIELDAIRALAGADQVRNKLLACLSMGSPSIASSVYLFKCRVKGHDKLVEKVLRRRASGNPAYTAQSATDIVGLRILTLYRSQLPSIVRMFFELVGMAQMQSVRLFPGEALKDCLREVIIYRASHSGDVTDKLIVDELTRLGLSVGPVADGSGTADAQADVRIIHKQSGYSSIHLVLNCVGVSFDARFWVPLEVQIRTSLEDTWGEIDHALNYKAAVPQSGSDHHEIALGHLRALKRLLDNCTEIGDLVFRQVQANAELISLERPKESARSVDTNKLLELSVDPAVKAALRDCVTRIETAFLAIYSKDATWITNPRDIEAFVEEFDAIGRELERCYDECRRQGLGEDADIKYYLKMERALCGYWTAYLCDFLSVRVEAIGFGKMREAALDAALSEHFELERDRRFSSDPILGFRIASALQLRGHQVIALERLEAANRSLQGSKLPAGHHMRVRIPRHLGVAYWDIAERDKREVLALKYPEFNANKRRELYLKALDVTLTAASTPVDASTFASAADQLDVKEDKITTNNILEYVLCYLKAGGDWNTLQSRGITKEHALGYLNEILGGSVAEIEKPTIADTVREGARLFGDPALARAAAARVLELVDKVDLLPVIAKEAYDEMRADAMSQLSMDQDPKEVLHGQA